MIVRISPRTAHYLNQAALFFEENADCKNNELSAMQRARQELVTAFYQAHKRIRPRLPWYRVVLRELLALVVILVFAALLSFEW
jgi:hypothetical protein